MLAVRRLLSVSQALRNVRFISSHEVKTVLEPVRSEITLSESCAKRLKEIGDGKALRVVIEGGGCSGFQYKFLFDDAVSGDDRIFEKDGAKIVIDSLSLEYVKGSTIDYHVELIKSSFQIVNNPLAERGCSCGSSFSIKSD